MQGATVTTETLTNSNLELHETFNAGTSRTALVIEASRSRTGINWREIWRYRELLYFLTWRDVKIRYKQTVMGGSWAILQPVMTMIVFSIFFGHLAGLSKQTDGIPYPIWSFAGVLPWTFFANSIANSGNSLVSSSSLITKVYFPRLVIPLAAVGAGLVDLAIAFVVLIGLMFYYHVAVTWQLVLVPVFLFGTIMTATGVGTLLSALIVAYRDFRYVVPFMIQLWMFISPVTYPSSMVPNKWRWVLALNPMSGLIDGFRSAFLGRPFDWPHIGVSIVVSACLFFIGAAYFRKVERRFADII
jgi:lipopolysaccharide transport system permease protein